MNNQTRNHLNLQKHIADQDHIIRVRNAEIAALRKRAEKAEKERGEAKYSAEVAKRQRDNWESVARQALAEQPRPLTPDAIEVAIRDCMPKVALDRLSGTQVMHLAEDMHAALTEPPARPEGAEEIEAYMRELVASHPEDHYGELADHLASRGVLPPLTDKTHPEEQP